VSTYATSKTESEKNEREKLPLLLELRSQLPGPAARIQAASARPDRETSLPPPSAGANSPPQSPNPPFLSLTFKLDVEAMGRSLREGRGQGRVIRRFRPN
jgi:hypothetical protein